MKLGSVYYNADTVLLWAVLYLLFSTADLCAILQILYYSELYCIYSPVLHALMIQYSSYCAMAPDTALFKPALELFSLPLPTENPTTFGLNSLMISVHQSIKTLVLAHAYQIILILIYTHTHTHYTQTHACILIILLLGMVVTSLRSPSPPTLHVHVWCASSWSW